MASSKSKPKLIVIVGPTASGKSDLAIKIAERHNGEVISADSRAIYKGLDIGTAKPTKENRRRVPHWGVDLIELGQPFTAADFQNYAKAKIKEIQDRGHLVVLVGGTGLYVDSVVFDFKFSPQADISDRAFLESLNAEQLQQEIGQKGLTMPKNKQNRRHLVRTLERNGTAPERRMTPLADTLLVGLLPPQDVLRRRIDDRADKMFRGEVLEEAHRITQDYPSVRLKDAGLVYELCGEVIAGNITKEEAIARFKVVDWQYARRQRTWFKRNPFIQWFNSGSLAEDYIDSALNT